MIACNLSEKTRRKWVSFLEQNFGSIFFIFSVPNVSCALRGYRTNQIKSYRLSRSNGHEDYLLDIFVPCDNFSLSLNRTEISHSILHWGIISEVDISAVRAEGHSRFCMESRRSRDGINEILSQRTQLALRRCFTNGASVRRYQFRSQVSCR